MIKDPVCGMTIDEKKTQYVLELDGKKFYPCSAAGKDQLTMNPKKCGQQSKAHVQPQNNAIRLQ